MEGFAWFNRMRRSFQQKAEQQINPDWPAWYQEYYTSENFKRPKEALLAEVPVVVIDAETTGLDVTTDRLISLGGLRVQGNQLQIGGHFEAYLPTPEAFAANEAVAIHGIIPNSQRYKYWREDEMLESLLAFLGDAIIVGHHISFDVTMINQALVKAGAGKLQNQVIDTAAVAERIQPQGYWTQPGQYSLDKLARRYSIPLSDRHTALGDAYITAILWLKLTGRLRERIPRELELADLTQRGR